MNKDIKVVNTVFDVNDDLLATAGDREQFSVLDGREYPLFIFEADTPMRDKFEQEYFLTDEKFDLQKVLNCE